MSDKVDLLHANKHESSYRLMLWFLMGDGQAFLKYPK